LDLRQAAALWSGAEGQQPGVRGREPAGTKVEGTQVVLEVHVQVLTSRRLGAVTGTGDKLGANAPAPGPRACPVDLRGWVV
jgi:uncharacterized protein (UPF0548 family)